MMDDDCVDDESEQCMVDKTSTTDLAPNVNKIPPTPQSPRTYTAHHRHLCCRSRLCTCIYRLCSCKTLVVIMKAWKKEG